MRKIIKTPCYPPGDDRLDVRPRRVSGATITSWRGPPEPDLATQFAKAEDHESITGAASAPANTQAREAANPKQDALVTFVTPNQFVTVAIL